MRITASLICAVMLLASGQVLASSEVTDVALHYRDGSAVARIDVKGPVRFTHQTEEAKDGKPFRVIVDVLSAKHRLPAKDYSSLPKCPVQGIRTSQYSVKPEKVVRLVFDMEEATLYRVDSDDNSITLFFPDERRREFASWTSAAYAAASKVVQETAADEPNQPTAAAPCPHAAGSKKSVAQFNEAIDEDRLLSLGGEPPSASTDTEPVKTEPVPAVDEQKPAAQTKPQAESVPAAAQARRKPVVIVDVAFGPEFDENLLQPLASEPVVAVSAPAKDQADEPSTSEKGQPAAAIVHKAVPEKGHTPSKPLAQQAAPPGKQIAPAKSDDKKAIVATEQKKVQPSAPTVAKKPESEVPQQRTAPPPEKKPAVQTVPETKKAGGGQDSTATVKDKKEPEKKMPTSRFRRSPTRPTKIQGTLVAEFPKRLVIKYRARSYRDPFETLINEAKTYNNPIEKRIPNIEGLELVGILESEAGPNSALFEDKDGYGYILRKGDKVRNGYVLRVEYDRVYFQIFEYGWSRTVALNIDED